MTPSACSKVAAFALTLLVLTSSTVLYAQSSSWTTASTTGFSGVGGTSAVAFGGKIYVMGGANKNGIFNNLEVYDPATDSWNTPTTTGRFSNRRNFGSAVVNGKIYVVGGDSLISAFSTGMVSLEVFDPATNSWSAPTTSGVCEPRVSRTCVSIGDNIYFIGGTSDGSPTSTISIFNTVSQSWSTPIVTGEYTPRILATACVVDGKIYVIGGLEGFAQNFTYSDKLEVFDPVTNSWSTPQTTGTFLPRGGLTCGVIDGKIYAVAGYQLEGQSEAFEIFDPATNAWSTPIVGGTHPRGNVPSSAVVGSRLYVFAGEIPGYPSTNGYYTPESLGIQNTESALEQISFSPNPTRDVVRIQGIPSAAVGIKVLNTLGITVIAIADPQGSELNVDLSALPSGVYFIEITSADSVLTKSVVLE